MRQFLSSIVFCILLSSCGAQEQTVKVVAVTDGDTIKVEINHAVERVRIIGIDTPETVDPRKPVQCFGKEASNHMKELLNGKNVVLISKPDEDRDKYKRLLRYISLDGRDIGAEMIRDGYAFNYPYFPHPRLELYGQLERQARAQNKGLWGNVCDYATSKKE